MPRNPRLALTGALLLAGVVFVSLFVALRGSGPFRAQLTENRGACCKDQGPGNSCAPHLNVTDVECKAIIGQDDGGFFMNYGSPDPSEIHDVNEACNAACGMNVPPPPPPPPPLCGNGLIDPEEECDPDDPTSLLVTPDRVIPLCTRECRFVGKCGDFLPNDGDNLMDIFDPQCYDNADSAAQCLDMGIKPIDEPDCNAVFHPEYDE